MAKVVLIIIGGAGTTVSGPDVQVVRIDNAQQSSPPNPAPEK